ncbi:MAG: DUF3307 domain-containing protein [Alphaproteobacteria bacterium]|nr:DUF3307 domain-containing protein [Alphaproteobacteria bacterium]MBL6938459.1 DUF3307 domain-containing protein [Alphaproteobacteria bacterium]MBL7096518.1 DUF3307 domain-containing protein [Alphaproteobacteria bacterium]
MALILWALLALELKHFLCDFVLQTEYQVRTKGIYGHFGGFIHSGLHIIGTIPALIILGASVKAMAIVLAAEFVIHYHADWMKIAVDKRTKWGMDDQRYWILFGLDQLIHQLTYIGILSTMASGLLA